MLQHKSQHNYVTLGTWFMYLSSSRKKRKKKKRKEKKTTAVVFGFVQSCPGLNTSRREKRQGPSELNTLTREKWPIPALRSRTRQMPQMLAWSWCTLLWGWVLPLPDNPMLCVVHEQMNCDQFSWNSIHRPAQKIHIHPDHLTVVCAHAPWYSTLASNRTRNPHSGCIWQHPYRMLELHNPGSASMSDMNSSLSCSSTYLPSFTSSLHSLPRSPDHSTAPNWHEGWDEDGGCWCSSQVRFVCSFKLV